MVKEWDFASGWAPDRTFDATVYVTDELRRLICEWLFPLLFKYKRDIDISKSISTSNDNNPRSQIVTRFLWILQILKGFSLDFAEFARMFTGLCLAFHRKSANPGEILVESAKAGEME